MPAFFSHYRFGFYSYKELETSFLKAAVVKHPHVFVLGCMGPDLFFYHLGNYTGNEKNFAKRLHEENTGEFLNYMFKKFLTASDKKSDKSQIELAYAVGFLAHYCLDTKAHPYVYSIVGTEKGKFYTGKHFQLESDIDLRVLEKFDNAKPSDYNISQIVSLMPKEREIVAHLLSNAVTKTLYGAHLSVEKSKIILKEIEAAMKIMQDKSGNKGKYAEFLENKILGYHFASPLLYNDLCAQIKNCCNEDHTVWLNPFTNHLTTQSFFDLFNEAKEEYVYMLKLFVNVVEKKKSYSEFTGLIGNRSYITGIALDDE